jgi:peptidoglycan/LPS O-acetylase OafA/YrhL
LAAWWVAAYHFREYLPSAPDCWIVAIIERGFYAVDLFFILSGFVLQLNYSRLFFTLNRSSLRTFAIARFARVYPLHLFMILVFLVNPLAIAIFSHKGLGPEQVAERYNPVDYIMSLFLIQNWGFRDHLAWNIPAWSISTEFAAYILFPIASYLTLRCIRSRATAIMAATVLLGTVSIVFWGTGASSLGEDIPRLGLPRCILEFLTGMILCSLFQLRGPSGGQIAQLVCAAVILAVCFAGLVPDYFGVPAAFALIVFGLTSPTGALSQLLSLRPLLYLGEISYATYLVHFFIKDWVKFLLDGHGVPH